MGKRVFVICDSVNCHCEAEQSEAVAILSATFEIATLGCASLAMTGINPGQLRRKQRNINQNSWE